MDKLDTYRALIKKRLSYHADLIRRQAPDQTEVILTFDEEHDHYLLLRIGWTPRGRLFVPTLFVRLLNEKIWIETDLTEDGLATDLLEEGVAHSDIVLAFHPPEKRPYTEFAVA